MRGDHANEGRSEADERRDRAHADVKNLPAEFPREQLEAMTNEFKRVAALHRDAEQELRGQEIQLSGEIAAEQGRWFDFNGWLDALERELK